MKLSRRALAAGAFAIGALALGLAADAWSRPLPEGDPSPEGDARARAMMAAVGADAWAATGAVSWTFAGRNEHLWDRERHLARVRWKRNEVLVDLHAIDGRAWVKGEEVHGERARELVEAAHASWVNDSFWLNPVVKAFDEGTVRIPLEYDGQRGVMVRYSSGGLTPGDSYLWLLGDDDVPTAWRMWVSIIPIGGARASWEGWTALDTGAKIATRHKMGPMKLEITDLRAAATLEALAGPEDPFAALDP